MRRTTTPRGNRVGTLPDGVGIQVGESAPDVTMRDEDGHDVRLHQFVANGPVVLLFYRGGWCPYCSAQIQMLTAVHEEFQERAVTLVALSVDRETEAAKTRATFTIPFPVLSDPDTDAHRAFRVLHQVNGDGARQLKRIGVDLQKSSGRDHGAIAIPSVFIIDRDGIVRWAHADRDYKVRPSAAQIVAAIDALQR